MAQQSKIHEGFCLEVDYQKDSPNPSRVFQSMSNLIGTIEKIDTHLVTIILDAKIQPVILLEDVEASSLKAWLRTTLNMIPDAALYNLQWEPIVGQYLVKAKHIIIDFTKDKTTITDIKQIKPLEDNLDKLADATQLKMLPAYKKIEPKLLMMDMNDMSQSLSSLTKQDSVKYIAGGRTSMFNLEFRVTPENIEDLISKNKIESTEDRILKVKTSDYLGDSKWEFKHGNKIEPYTMLDKPWVEKYHNRGVIVQPQDSIKATVRIERKYDYDNELIAEHFSVIKVIDVIPPEPQLPFENLKS